MIDQPNRWKSDPCCAKLWKNPGRSSTDWLTSLVGARRGPERGHWACRAEAETEPLRHLAGHGRGLEMELPPVWAPAWLVWARQGPESGPPGLSGRGREEQWWLGTCTGQETETPPVGAPAGPVWASLRLVDVQESHCQRTSRNSVWRSCLLY